MTEHKAPLTIVGMTGAGKTVTLAKAALEQCAQVSPESIVVFVNDESQPVEIIRLLKMQSVHAIPQDPTLERLPSNFYIAPPDVAAYLLADQRETGKDAFLFIDCVGQTSVSADHEGMRISFHGEESELLNSLTENATLQGVTVSNWGA